MSFPAHQRMVGVLLTPWAPRVFDLPVWTPPPPFIVPGRPVVEVVAGLLRRLERAADEVELAPQHDPDEVELLGAVPGESAPRCLAVIWLGATFDQVGEALRQLRTAKFRPPVTSNRFVQARAA